MKQKELNKNSEEKAKDRLCINKLYIAFIFSIYLCYFLCFYFLALNKPKQVDVIILNNIIAFCLVKRLEKIWKLSYNKYVIKFKNITGVVKTRNCKKQKHKKENKKNKTKNKLPIVIASLYLFDVSLQWQLGYRKSEGTFHFLNLNEPYSGYYVRGRLQKLVMRLN